MSTDAGEPVGQQQERERASHADEARELLGRMRSASAEELVAELCSTLLTTAQVKLGRRDARVFIDLCALMLEHAGRYLSQDVRKQMETSLGHLRLGQVTAENQAARSGELEPNDLSRIPTPPRTDGRTVAGSSNPPASSSKLWVPGH